MRRLYMILSALTLSVVTLVATAVPAAADPGDNQPVAWVNFTGSNADLHRYADPDFTHNNVQISVKRLSDGSTVGHMSTKKMDTKVEIIWPILDSHFSVRGDGAKIADILTTGTGEAGNFPFWWRLIDAGEPGEGADGYQLYVWAQAVPYFAPDGPPAWWPVDPASDLFPAGLPICWLPWSAETIGNIQVHITDAYTP